MTLQYNDGTTTEKSKHMSNTHRHHFDSFNEIAGKKWAIIVIDVLGYDTVRFSALKRLLPGVSQKVLTETLRNLERNGLVLRKIYPTIPPHVEYKLSDSGFELLSIAGEMDKWIERHEEHISRSRRTYDRIKQRITPVRS